MANRDKWPDRTDVIRGIAFETPALAVPDDPAAPTVTALNSSSIQAVGVAPDANPAITSYDWQYRVVGTSPWTDVLDQTNLTQTFTSLDPSRNYEVQFRATNSVGDSGYSDSGTAQTSNVNPTVTVQTVNQTVDAGATVSLTATATDQGGGSIASYLWSGSGVFASSGLEDTDWTAPSPDTDTDYTLRLTVTDDEGATSFNTVIITVRGVPQFDADAEPITWTFNIGSATGATLAAPPAPTLLQPSNTQVGAIGTTTAYFVTFQYDDNSSFTSPSTVYDLVESSSHSAYWTPPSGFTYIRARFTTLIRDGGTRGAWSDTITYGTAPSFDGDAEAITWTFNVGSATGEATIPEFTADAEPITWTFNVGEATGSTTAPTVPLQLDDIDDTGIVTYVKMLVTSGIAESSGTVYKNNGSLGVLESGSDATLATGNVISRIALNTDGRLGEIRFWANPNFFTDKPNALVRMQFAPAGPIYEFPFLNHGSNFSDFRNVAAASALTAAQTAGERFLLVVYQFPEFDGDAEPITWTFNVGSATGEATIPEFTADAEPITWTFNVGEATGSTTAPTVPLQLDDIDDTGIVTYVKMLVTSGIAESSGTVYKNNGSLGVLESGSDATLATGNVISRIALNTDGRLGEIRFWANPNFFTDKPNALVRMQFAPAGPIYEFPFLNHGSNFSDFRNVAAASALTAAQTAGERFLLVVYQFPEFDADAEPITWTFNVGSATGSTVAPSFNADAEPITWTFNIGSATGEAEEPVASLALSDRIIPADTDTVFAGLIEVGVDGTTRYRYDGAGDPDNEGSLVGGDAQLTGTLAIEWLRVEATRVILNRRTTSDQFDAQLETGQPLNNATLYLQDAGGAVSVLISDIDDAQIGGGFFDVRTSITGGQAFRDKLNALGTGDRLILSMTQPEAASEFDADAEPITWTFNVGSATGSATVPEFTADAEPITWTFNVGSATGATTAPEFSANAEAITWSFNLGTATGSLVDVASPSERAILDARALTGVDQIYALEISHSALSQSIKIVGDIIEHEIESNTYLPLMFQAEIPQSKEGEIRQATIRIDNIGYELMQWVNDTQGGRDAVIRAMMVVPPEGTETQSAIIWEVTMNCGVTEITNEYVIVTLTDEPVFDRPSVLLRHDPSISPGLF